MHNNAINENLNWGGFPGCYSSLPPTVDLVPRSRTTPGGRGKGGERSERRQELNTTNKELDSMSNNELLSRRFRRETTTSKDEAIETSKGGTTIQTDDQMEASSLKVVRIPGKGRRFNGRPRFHPES